MMMIINERILEFHLTIVHVLDGDIDIPGWFLLAWLMLYRNASLESKTDILFILWQLWTAVTYLFRFSYAIQEH